MNCQRMGLVALRKLALGEVFTFEGLFDAIQELRGRRVRIAELTSLNHQDGICGVWLVTESEDLVLYARSDSHLHRQQFILHEFAHMILDHCEVGECEMVDVLLPDIPPRTRARILRRQDLDSEMEIAAECLADRLAAGIRGSALATSRYLEIFG